MRSPIAPDFSSSLLSWYDAKRRDLPWRHVQGGPHPEPYHVLVSEIMLQQTTVTTVIPRFGQWLAEYPTVRDLSEAGPDRVLRSWEGLGYYSRARNLHAAAREIVSGYGGRVPSDPRELKKLPGIGDYTAAAVASIAYGVPAPALDANNIRVWSRLLATSDRRRIARVFGRVISADRPGDFNQALMDLGSAVCVPENPNCHVCPLSPWCRAFEKQLVDRFPEKRGTPQVERVEAAIGIIVRDGKVLVQRRPETGLMARLWEFPGGKIGKGEKEKRGKEDRAGIGVSEYRGVGETPLETPEEAVVREVKEETGLKVEVCGKLGVFTHAYTRFRVKLHVFICERKSGRLTNPSGRWVTLQELEDLAMPSVNRRIVKRLEEYLTAEDAE